MMCKSGYIVILWATILASVGFLHAQDNVILQFTGQDQNGGYVKLDRVLVENISKHWQEVLYYPDTVLHIGGVGIEENLGLGEGVRLFQNVPNPFEGVTDFSLYIPNSSKVLIEIHDLNGKVMTSYSGSLEQGSHQFRAWLEIPQNYLLNARDKDGTVLIKMVNTGHAAQNRMEYLGKASVPDGGKADKGNTNQPFSLGDVMLYKGFVHLAGTEYESVHVVQEQFGSELIPLTFTLPLPTVTTEAASDITTSQVQLNGSVAETPGYPITERGFELADNSQLTGATTYIAGSGNGSFHYTVSNLQLATRYYYRTYAQTALGVQHGGVLFFDTQAELPEVHTDSVTNVKSSRATCGGNVTYNGGAYVTARGVCWSTAPNPTLSDSHTDDGNGIGTFTSSIAGLSASTTYYVRAYATNSVGTAYGEERTLTTWPPFYCGLDSVTDYDGNVYPTVEIGYQCWMKENLRTTHYDDGTAIPVGTVLSDSVPYRYAPNDNSANVPTYGYLYNWAAVMHGDSSSNANPSGVQGICPEGWHVPSYAEWVQLTNYVGGQNQYICDGDINNIAKALAANTGWGSFSEQSCEVNCYPLSNNATGFAAFPAGSFNGSTSIDYGYSTSLWSSTHFTDYGNSAACCFRIGHESYTQHHNILQQYCYSARCLLDDAGLNDSIAVTPVVTTKAMKHITPTSADCVGMVVASGGADVSVRGVCWSTSPNPTVSDNHTNDGSGTGTFTSNITGLSANTTYWVRTYATNCAGTSYGQMRSFTTPSPITCGIDSITDYDGNFYHTVLIGQQCWLKENLRTTHYADGTPILEGTVTSDTIPYRYAPGNQSDIVPFFGYHYNWIATIREHIPEGVDPGDVQGVCPAGWHVPNKMEWIQLRNYVMNHLQPPYTVAMALASTVSWQGGGDTFGTISYYPSANNTSGFTALPADMTTFLGNGQADFWGYLYYYAYFWSSTLVGNLNDHAVDFMLEYDNPDATIDFSNIRNGLSVRCLRD